MFSVTHASSTILKIGASSALRRCGMAPSQHVVASSSRFLSSASGNVISLSDGDAVTKFRKLNSNSVLYFTATWCPPCKMIKPAYNKLSKSYPNVAFGMVDIDENEDAAQQFQIASVPTFFFFKGEENPESMFTGANEKQLVQLLEEIYGKP